MRCSVERGVYRHEVDVDELLRFGRARMRSADEVDEGVRGRDGVAIGRCVERVAVDRQRAGMQGAPRSAPHQRAHAVTAREQCRNEGARDVAGRAGHEHAVCCAIQADGPSNSNCRPAVEVSITALRDGSSPGNVSGDPERLVQADCMERAPDAISVHVPAFELREPAAGASELRCRVLRRIPLDERRHDAVERRHAIGRYRDAPARASLASSARLRPASRPHAATARVDIAWRAQPTSRAAAENRARAGRGRTSAVSKAAALQD